MNVDYLISSSHLIAGFGTFLASEKESNTHTCEIFNRRFKLICIIDLDKAAISSGLSLSAGVPSTLRIISPLRRPASCAGDPSSVLATTVVPRKVVDFPSTVEGTNTSSSTPIPVN